MALVWPADRGTPPSLGGLWNAGLRGHNAGCACGLAMPPLDPRAIEIDLLDYLYARYEGEGETALTDSIAKLAAAPTGSAPWLDHLDTLALPAPQRERLAADLRTFLESLAGNAAGIGPCY